MGNERLISVCLIDMLARKSPIFGLFSERTSCKVMGCEPPKREFMKDVKMIQNYLQNLEQEIKQSSIPDESIKLVINSLRGKINSTSETPKEETLLKIIDKMEEILDAEVF